MSVHACVCARAHVPTIYWMETVDKHTYIDQHHMHMATVPEYYNTIETY